MKIIANDKEHLLTLIENEMELHGNKCDLNHIDVSNVWNMESLFKCSAFNGNISEWNTSKVRDMKEMFYESQFNGDISSWNVGNVKNMVYMFTSSKFNGDISKWDVGNVENMAYMFYKSQFGQDLSDWTPYWLNNKNNMFLETKAIVPYWSEYDNFDYNGRNQGINSYKKKKELMNKLNEELEINKINENLPKQKL